MDKAATGEPEMAAAQVNVLCIKWGHKYGSDYVDRLYRMVSRHLSRPFRFVCLTDEPDGIDPAIETRPIPRIGFAPFDQREPWVFQHGWLKLTCLADPLHDIVGRTLFLDLDIVIVDALDPFFDGQAPFTVIKEWDKRDGTGNTSVFLFEAGAHADALDHLKTGYPAALKKVRNEQEFMTGFIRDQGQLHYWPEDWCRSFKRHCLQSGLASWFRPPEIPRGARIIIFHGKPNPPDAIRGVSGKWYRRVLPTPWVDLHWR